MKITLKKLRNVVREEIENSRVTMSANDDQLRPGRDVAVATPTGSVMGKVVSRHSGDGPESVWTVKTDSGVMQLKADQLKTSDEAGTVTGRSNMLHGSEDDKDGDRDGDGLSDDDLLVDITEAVDEEHEQKEFTKRHYEFIARQIVFNWRDRTPEVSWVAVAKNFARGLRASTGKIIDVEKLADAIETCLNDDDAYEAQWKQRKEMIGV